MVHASLIMGLWIRFAAARRRLHRRKEWAYSVFSRVNSFSERGLRYHDYTVRPCTLLFIPSWGCDALALPLAMVGWRSQVIRRPVHHLNARTKNFGEDHPPAGFNRLLPQPYIEVYQVASGLQTRQYVWANLYYFSDGCCSPSAHVNRVTWNWRLGTGSVKSTEANPQQTVLVGTTSVRTLIPRGGSK